MKTNERKPDMTTANAAIAQHLNILESAIKEIQEWAHVLFVKFTTGRPRFVSKKVVKQETKEMATEFVPINGKIYLPIDEATLDSHVHIVALVESATRKVKHLRYASESEAELLEDADDDEVNGTYWWDLTPRGVYRLGASDKIGGIWQNNPTKQTSLVYDEYGMLKGFLK